MRISDWSSDVCSSDLVQGPRSTNDSSILSGRARVIRCICHYAGVSGPMRSHSQNRINDPSESCMHMAEPNPVPQVRLGPVERLIATGISTLAFAMLSWLVYTNNENALKIALIQKDIQFIQSDMTQTKEAIKTSYSQSQASQLESRMARIEQKLGI